MRSNKRMQSDAAGQWQKEMQLLGWGSQNLHCNRLRKTADKLLLDKITPRLYTTCQC